MTVDELQRRETYHHAINSTILPSYRAIAYRNVTNAALGNEGPIGYVDFNNEDGNALLGIFAIMYVFILWFTCVCWNFGGAGLDMAYDADVIFKTIDGAVYKTEEIPLQSIPITGSGKLGDYSNRVRQICHRLMCLIILIAIIQLSHQFMRGEFINTALEETYGQEYIAWKETYEPYAAYTYETTNTTRNLWEVRDLSQVAANTTASSPNVSVPVQRAATNTGVHVPLVAGMTAQTNADHKLFFKAITE